MKKNISVSIINALLEDKKKDFNHFMKVGDYETAYDMRMQAIGIIQVLSMTLTDNDPVKYRDFYEEKLDGLERSYDMLLWEIDHLRQVC